MELNKLAKIINERLVSNAKEARRAHEEDRSDAEEYYGGKASEDLYILGTLTHNIYTYERIALSNFISNGGEYHGIDRH